MVSDSPRNTFFSLIKNRSENVSSLLCVGLDPELSTMPDQFQMTALPLSEKILSFIKAIIDATHEDVCCYKPQSAFFEQYGVEGLKALIEIVDYIHETYPDIPVLLDAKRGDIGSTANAYAKSVFDMIKADGVTVNPYLGKDSLEPFLQRKEKGIIILAKTSNAGSNDFQNKYVEERPLYEHVAKTVVSEWNVNNNCGLVVGATYPQELKKVREIVGDMPLLIPGIGAQGGNIKETVAAGKDKNGMGMIISSSRAILYASRGGDFAQAAKSIAKSTKDEINRYR